MERGNLLKALSILREDVYKLEGEKEMLKEKEEALEVAENDLSVLKQSLQNAETEKNGLALDLAEVAKQKLALESTVEAMKDKVANLEKVSGDLKVELEEAEMSRHGLEGEVSSSREEVAQLEVANCELRDLLEQANNGIKDYVDVAIEKEQLLEQTRELVSKQEELQRLNEQMKHRLEHEKAQLTEELAKEKSSVEELQAQIDAVSQELDRAKLEMGDLGSEKVDTEGKLELAEDRAKKLEEVLEEQKVQREEVEETLLDTQELVNVLEEKLNEAFRSHKTEVSQYNVEVNTLQSTVEQLQGERDSLLEMNTDLSGQLTENLHNVASLQEREQMLQKESLFVRQQLQAAQEDSESDRIRLMQAEDEILSLQAEIDASLVEMEQCSRRTIAAAEKSLALESQLEDTQRKCGEQVENLTAQLDNIKMAYNSAVTELGESKTVGQQLLARVDAVESELQQTERKLKASLLSGEEEKRKHGEEMELLNDKVGHLEGLRDNLEMTVAEKLDQVEKLKKEIQEVKEELIKTHSKADELNKSNLRFKGNMELRVAEIGQLKNEFSMKESDLAKAKEQIAGKEREVENLGRKVAELTEEKEELATMRLAEAEKMCQLRDELENSRDEIETAKRALEDARLGIEELESVKRSMEAQQVVLMEAENKAADAEELSEAR